MNKSAPKIHNSYPVILGMSISDPECGNMLLRCINRWEKKRISFCIDKDEKLPSMDGSPLLLEKTKERKLKMSGYNESVCRSVKKWQRIEFMHKRLQGHNSKYKERSICNDLYRRLFCDREGGYNLQQHSKSEHIWIIKYLEFDFT